MTETIQRTKTSAAPNECESCWHELDRDYVDNPYQEGRLCSDCYHEQYEFTCHWCEEGEHQDHEATVGSLFAVFEPIDG